MSMDKDDVDSVYNKLDLADDKTREHVHDVTFSLAKHFQSNMVLQRGPARAAVYGFAAGADVGQAVLVEMTTPGKTLTYSSKVTLSPTYGYGVWKVTLDPMVANTTATIKVTFGKIVLNLDNLIFGDVWLCGGQSNMQFTVSMMFGAEAEIADANNHPNIRLMTVDNRMSIVPLDDLIQIEQNWTVASNASVGNGGKIWKYFSAVCWLYGKKIHEELRVPIGLVASTWGGTGVGFWSSLDAVNVCKKKPGDTDIEKELTNLTAPIPGGGRGWNSMIRPLMGMTIYGAIWYQGEADANIHNRDHYNCTFPAMIADWRAKARELSGQTDATFPFGFVQLAPFHNGSTDIDSYPDIRWHQTADVGFVPNPKMEKVFMAVALDLPDFSSPYTPVHPRYKLDVGLRLAQSGLAVAYDYKYIFQGPFPHNGVPDGKVVNISYTTPINVEIKDGFEWLCQPGSTWVATTIVGSNSTSISLDATVCPAQTRVAGVRYAWRESPCEFKKCAIYGTTSLALPGPPFIITAISGDNNDQLSAEFDTPVGRGLFTFSEN